MGELPSADLSSRYDIDLFPQLQGFFAISTAAFCPALRCYPLTKWLFGLCYAMDGGYKGCNPYIERHLAIFVNYFLSRAN